MNADWTLFHQGSVKNIFKNNIDNELVFNFSDRYSVFDWGEMPDEIEGKGECLAFLADFFFRHLSLENHGIGLCCPDGSSVNDQLTSCYKVQGVNIIKPTFNGRTGYDYGLYKKELVNALVPLEVVFRFGLPSGSSFFSRASDRDYLDSIGVQEIPNSGEVLDIPIIEFSTKLESEDRYISYDEAMKIANMTKAELESLKSITIKLAKELKSIFNSIDVSLWDGKFEFAFIAGKEEERSFMLVDSVGPDELRLKFEDQSLSKEFLRQFYRESEWYTNVEKAKSLAKERGLEDWKDICLGELNSSPGLLSPEYAEAASMLYKTLVNSLSKKFDKKEVFENCDSLMELSKRMEKL